MDIKTKRLLYLSLFVIIFGIMFLYFGISQLNRDRTYYAPVYISRKFTITGHSEYTVSGQIANMTSSDITISSIEIPLGGNDSSGGNRYHTTWTQYNIIIPANGTKDLREDNLVYYFETGFIAEGRLTRAGTPKCRINGTDYYLQYSLNGKDFDTGINDNTSILFIVIGSILLITPLIVAIAIKKKHGFN